MFDLLLLHIKKCIHLKFYFYICPAGKSVGQSSSGHYRVSIVLPSAHCEGSK